MLVLSRKKGERVAIADTEIIVTVVDIRGDKVRLGFDAAKDISIHRMEVYEAINRKLSEQAAEQAAELEELQAAS